MAKLIPIKYGKKTYPLGISPIITEVAAHFDKTFNEFDFPYSLHTEYSFGKRKLNSSIILKYEKLRNANKNMVPQLWENNEWSKEFADFIFDIVGDNKNPEIIEIHPPFNDYCSSIDLFLERYLIFERLIKGRFPNTKIFLENRSGSVYSSGIFLVSKNDDIKILLRKIRDLNSNLRLVLDYPQLLTAEDFDLVDFDIIRFKKLHKELSQYKDLISGIHIWGKKLGASGRLCAHSGDLTTLFFGNNEHKTLFLEELQDFYDDGLERYFIPEVNSSQIHLDNIVMDFKKTGFEFV